MKNYQALRYKKDEGFTLIELLVVILIIAILAAVGIVALLSALNSGRKSSATTVLRNGITAIRSAQSSRGQTDYTGIDATVMNTAEPDINWVGWSTNPTVGESSISIYNSTTVIFISTRSEKGICYYARLDSAPTSVTRPTMYGSVDGPTCGLSASDIQFWSRTKNGWDK